jgi:pyruvate dehydrogenase E2 component (dihydrolipoamide acetyltransferase)
MTDATLRRTAVTPTPMRQAIARRMSESNRDVPQFSVSALVDLDAALEALESANARDDRPRITLTAFLVFGVAAALRAHSAVNSCWDGGELYVHEDINVGVAVAVEGGLLAPALLDAGQMTLVETAAALDDLVNRARASRLRAQELTAATFTLTNLGMFDVAAFTPIVTPPQVAILATSSVAARPVLDGESWRPVRSLTATLACDHRALDGADAARFLQTFKSALLDVSQLTSEVGLAA